MKTGFVKVNSKSIYFELINESLISENNNLLIFLHEGLGSCAQWKDFPYKLSKKIKMPALLYDRYGYGKSEELNEARQNTYLEDEASLYLPELLKVLNLNFLNKILVGHSDGGTIALIFAALFPDKTKAVITEAAHVFAEEITFKGVKPMAEQFENGGLKEKLKKYHLEKTDKMFYAWYNIWSNGDLENWNVEHYLDDIRCPVYAIQGENDEYGSVRQLESIKRNIKKSAQILLIQACGHSPHRQAKGFVVAEMTKFIVNL